MKLRSQIFNPGLIGAIFGYRSPHSREWQSRQQMLALGHTERKALTPVCQWPIEWLTAEERAEFLPPQNHSSRRVIGGGRNVGKTHAQASKH